MKSMTCKQLGGACDVVFEAETFEEIAALSKKHGTAMYKTADEAHMKAMSVMMELMKNPADMKKWFDGKRAEFNAL